MILGEEEEGTEEVRGKYTEEEERCEKDL